MRLFLCLISELLLSGSLPATAGILYSVTDLGVLPGYFGATCTGINNVGQVVDIPLLSMATPCLNMHFFTAMAR